MDVLFINGTLIMLADGSQKKIEDVLPTDKLLSFNHNTGMIEEAYGFMIKRSNYDLSITKVLIMFFEKDNQISIVDCHRFFDTILMKYIEINYNNLSDYIVHKFLTIKYLDGQFKYEEIAILNIEFKMEEVYIYSPLTFININAIIDNLLTAPGGNLEGLFNYFDYDVYYK